MTGDLTLVGWLAVSVIVCMLLGWTLVIGWFWCSIALCRGTAMANSIMGGMLKQAWRAFVGLE